ncbi:TPA: fumarate hydratase [Candidatus Gracilibacteria bacterium]|nr:fumarate hydratase [Candidatus Gracilibacteria bacterium]HIQ57135.1 fumarate hydratase [Candidatus Gracilibacteria bacterium]
MFIFPQILDLIKNVSTTLPQDIQDALHHARTIEKKDNIAANISLDIINKNIDISAFEKVPMCQDTGFPTFFVAYNPKLHANRIDEEYIIEQIKKAVKMATKNGLLRPNAVDSLTGKNSGTNIGDDYPKIIFEKNFDLQLHEIQLKLILKGGGSENVSDQFALPAKTDFGRANRDLEGVKKAVLQIVKNAEGKGCAPGILGIHIGGDRGTGYDKAKKNLFTPLFEKNENEILEKLETKILAEANQLNIGPMGFGGKSTILSCRVSVSHRLPACFFVTVVYNCWALRRAEIIIDLESGKVQKSEKYNNPKNITNTTKNIQELDFSNAKKLHFPITSEDVKKLEFGDIVLLSGKIYTGRDTLHHAVVEEKLELPIDISGSAIYHCGPIMKQNENGEWYAYSAGPTTSIREEPYQADFIEKTGIKAVIGKGNMGDKTLAALRKNNAVYLHAIGGAATIYAKSITKVSSVHFLEKFGMPEAMWELEIADFPVRVSMI